MNLFSKKEKLHAVNHFPVGQVSLAGMKRGSQELKFSLISVHSWGSGRAGPGQEEDLGGKSKKVTNPGQLPKGLSE